MTRRTSRSTSSGAKTGPRGKAPPTDDQTAGSGETVQVADSIAAAALAVPGVTRLHAGSFGEVATYLPGRRVVGVRSAETLTEVHVVVATSTPVLPVAEAVRDAVQPFVETPVNVYIEDLDDPS